MDENRQVLKDGVSKMVNQLMHGNTDMLNAFVSTVHECFKTGNIKII